MTTQMATPDTAAALLERVVMSGDLSRLTPTDRLTYYRTVCDSVGLNPYTRPFDYIHLSGKLTLYAKKDATDQLRKIHGVSIFKLEREVVEGLYVVTAYARDKEGREDSDIGAVAIDGLKGEARANAILKAVTKAKRRTTLSICGLGMLDETEIDSIPGAVVGEVKPPRAPETLDEEAARLFPTPEEERLAETRTALERIRGAFVVMALSPEEQTALWQTACPGVPLLSEDADPAVLQAFIEVLIRKHQEAQAAKRRPAR